METTIWPTQKHDLALANQILLTYRHEGMTELNLEQVTLIKDGEIIIENADWVIDLSQAFEEKYGPVMGWDVTKRVISSLMIEDQPIH
mgnify:CR=1 FL=1